LILIQLLIFFLYYLGCQHERHKLTAWEKLDSKAIGTMGQHVTCTWKSNGREELPSRGKALPDDLPGKRSFELKT